MEKYRKFADPGTGINPFLPAHLAAPHSRSDISKFLQVSICSISVVIRLPLLIVWALLCGASDLLFMIPIISSILVRPLIRPLISMFGVLLLGIFVNPSMNVEDFRRLRVKRPAHDSYKSGDFTFTSYSGFVDILIHAIVTRPSAFLLKNSRGNWSVYYSVLLAVFACRFGATSALESKSTTKLPKRALVFINHAPTNGLGVLKTDSASFAHLTKDKPFQITKLNYYSGSFAPHHVVGSFISHILSLMLKNGFTTVSVYSLPDPIADTTLITSMLSRLTESVPETQVPEESYHEFLAYWNKTQDISYVRN